MLTGDWLRAANALLGELLCKAVGAERLFVARRELLANQHLVAAGAREALAVPRRPLVRDTALVDHLHDNTASVDSRLRPRRPAPLSRQRPLLSLRHDATNTTHQRRAACARRRNDVTRCSSIDRNDTRGPLRGNITPSVQPEEHITYIATPPEEDRATAIGNMPAGDMHKQLVKTGLRVSK